MGNKQEKWDVVVIGGGPAGMMAAGRAAELGARVLLLEKNERLGKKLGITGGGRCNITNVEPDMRKWTAKFGERGKFLFPALSRFGVSETLDFFHEQGLPTMVEEESRAFPKSESAEDVCRVMVDYVKQNGVAVRYRSIVSGFETSDGKIAGVRVNDEVLSAHAYILATGGKSRPETGSTGDGFVWLGALGHTIVEPDPALVPVVISESWVREAQGLSLSDIRLSVWQDGKKHMSRTGRILFTHFGLSGPLVLNMSREIRELCKQGPVTLSLDLFPGVDGSVLDSKVQETFSQHQNKQLKNSLSELIPDRLLSGILQLSGIDPDREVNGITRQERLRLVQILKGMSMRVSGFLGYDKAIVTSGGVALEEVNFRTMQSRLYPELYLTGDVLDFNRPSGGFSLQICWTTGRIAGEHAASKKLKE